MLSKYQPHLMTALVAVVAIAGAYFVMETGPSTYTYTAPEPTLAPVCEIECLIARRTEDILVRDAHIYREQARLNAMLEINAQLQEMVYPD